MSIAHTGIKFISKIQKALNGKSVVFIHIIRVLGTLYSFNSLANMIKLLLY